ncbi:MAG: GNAT family N-acetyltransferase [Chloroflexales bacterium]|nr:GNAT family N-acetyltransferase [Chloroflexales bacterium]
MKLFRRNLDISHAAPRPATSADLTRVSRLLRDGARRFQGFVGGELEPLLASAPGIVLEGDGELWGVALCSWRVANTSWLRGFALAEGLAVAKGADALLGPLHALLRTQGLAQLYYSGDDASALWLQPLLLDRGYVIDTNVVVYEKRALFVPGAGNQQAVVRAARASDADAVTTLDGRCFDAQWTKDAHVLGPAIVQGPLFSVAELEGRLAGYAYATSHFGGRLIHLVRIAVDPQFQGQGIGVRLLAEVVDYARAHGADTITLNTQSYNAHAQRLYQWFGFNLTGERQTVLRHDLN